MAVLKIDNLLFYLMAGFVILASLSRWALARKYRFLVDENAPEGAQSDVKAMPSKEVLTSKGLVVYYAYWFSGVVLCTLAIGYGIAQVIG